LGDEPFYQWIESHIEKLMSLDEAILTEAIARSCQNKADIVALDEREGGVRALLNLGHTFGHALEAQIGFEDKLKHGEAVAIGMMMALELSVRLAMASEIDRDRLRDHLKTVGLPVDLKGLAGGNWTADALLDHMGRDKKTQDGKLTFILARAIGNSFVANDVDHDAVKGVLEGFIADAR